MLWTGKEGVSAKAWRSEVAEGRADDAGKGGRREEGVEKWL
jgi:hypothetical protein